MFCLENKTLRKQNKTVRALFGPRHYCLLFGLKHGVAYKFMGHIVVGSVLNPYSVLTHSKVFSLEMLYFERKKLKVSINIIFLFADHHVDIDFSFSLLALL